MRQKIHKEDIVKSGYELMFLRGFNSVGIKEITDKAKIPKGSFYNHFESKEVFGQEVLSYYMEKVITSLEKTLLNEKVAPIDRLKKYYEDIIKYQEEVLKYSLGCLLGNFSQELADVNETFAELLNEAFLGKKKYFKKCIQEAIHVNQIAKDSDADLLSDYLINSWQGSLIRMKASKNILPLQQFYEITFNKLLK